MWEGGELNFDLSKSLVHIFTLQVSAENTLHVYFGNPSAFVIFSHVEMSLFILNNLSEWRSSNLDLINFPQNFMFF